MFQFKGHSYDYFTAKKHGTTERSVEIPLGHAFASRFKKQSMLEVGNVMRAHYPFPFMHQVIDLNEKRPGWKNYDNFDVLKWQPPQLPLPAVLSLSTLEHTEDPVDALFRVLSWAPNVLVTMPMGYHSLINKQFFATQLAIKPVPADTDIRFLRRVALPRDWREISLDEFNRLDPDQFRYNQHGPAANLIAVWTKGVIA